jgi:hypothetical protein
MSHGIEPLAVGLFWSLVLRICWSLGEIIAVYFRARKEARESQEEWAWQVLGLFVFVFVVSALAISMSDAIRPRAA